MRKYKEKKCQKKREMTSKKNKMLKILIGLDGVQAEIMKQLPTA